MMPTIRLPIGSARYTCAPRCTPFGLLCNWTGPSRGKDCNFLQAHLRAVACFCMGIINHHIDGDYHAAWLICFLQTMLPQEHVCI